MIRVMHFVTDFSATGGDYVYVRELLTYLSEVHGGEIELFLLEVLSHGEGRDSSVYAQMDAIGIRHHHVIPCSENANFYDIVRFANELILKYSINVLHTHIFFTELVADACKRGLKAYCSSWAQQLSVAEKSILCEILRSEIHVSSTGSNREIYRDALLGVAFSLPEEEQTVDVLVVSTKHLERFKSICHDQEIIALFESDPDRTAQALALNYRMQALVSASADLVITGGSQRSMEAWKQVNPTCRCIPVSIVRNRDLQICDTTVSARYAYPSAPLLGAVGVKYIFVGRLAVSKRPDILVEAFCAHLQSFPEDSLTIVGEGPLAHRCKQISNGDERIQYLDHLPHDEIYSLLATKDALCIFSMSESGPLVVQEGMAAHLAILGSKVGMIPDLVAHGESGLIVDNVSVSNIVDTLDTYSSLSPAGRRQMGESSRGRLDLLGTTEQGFEQYIDAYRSLSISVPLTVDSPFV